MHCEEGKCVSLQLLFCEMCHEATILLRKSFVRDFLNGCRIKKGLNFKGFFSQNNTLFMFCLACGVGN